MTKNLILSVVLGLCLLGCQQSNDVPKLVKVYDKKEVVSEELGSGEQFTPPDVDILFVIDNSGSMRNYISRLSQNLGAFVSALNANPFVNYNFGYFLADLADSNQKEPGFVQAVGNSLDKTSMALFTGKLASIGTGAYGTEIFLKTTQLAIQEPAMLSPLNKQFFRKDSHLVIVYLTDTRDQSALHEKSADFDLEEFKTELIEFKNGQREKILVFGAYIPVGFKSGDVVDGVECKRDPVNKFDSQDPELITDLIFEFGGTYFNICSLDYGDKLSRVAEEIVARVRKRIDLKEIPRPDTIEVRWGDQVIPNDPLEGWSYDPKNNALVFGPDLVIERIDPNAKLDVRFVTSNVSEGDKL